MNVGSLCSGYGGLDLALQAVTGATVAWHCEIEAAPSKVLAHHWPVVPNLGDMTAIDWTSVPRVDWFTAGYPCQPFSHAGKRKGSADERHVWPFVADAIGVLRPRRVLLENVRGHVSLGLADVLGDLSGLGYDARWGVVRAADAGAPHGRARLFVVAADATINQGRLGHGDDVRDELRHERSGLTRGRRRGPADHREPAPDSERSGRDGWSPEPQRGPLRRVAAAGCGEVAVAWGEYEPAIRRWERILGRPAPRPTEPGRSGERLTPRFVEWLMGLPDGWVTGVPGIGRNQALKMLGNGVVPQQAALALRLLLADACEVAA